MPGAPSSHLFPVIAAAAQDSAHKMSPSWTILPEGKTPNSNHGKFYST